MAQRSSKRSVSQQIRRSEINLVSARSAYNAGSDSYSRVTREGGYAAQRDKRARNRRNITIVVVVLVALLIAGSVAAYAFVTYLDNQLGTDSSGNRLDLSTLSAATVDREKPEDPFWMLLVGTDDEEAGEGVSRSDTIILTRVDPINKVAAMVSVPRDTKVNIPGYGTQKINAAYAYGNLEQPEHSGPEFCINAVTELTGVGIASYAQVDFYGFKDVVDALGGVFVDVPVEIIGDSDAGGLDIYTGPQVLDGEHALVFVRSRQFDIGDFQRQANQRTFLQAMAAQILSADPVTIVNTVTKIAEISTTNLKVSEIASIANSMRGMSEYDIYTYSLPGENDMIDGVAYVVVDAQETQDLMEQLSAGVYPNYSDMLYQGEIPDEYRPKGQSTATDNLGTAVTGTYTVAVRNGYGRPGVATAVSDMLNLAGYKQGEVGNANSMIYKETLIIYRDDADLEAAEDIKARLGYGRIIPSLERYSFEGNVLVVVGDDFKG
jgi:LCP family protein required for cell wall assembly